MSDLENDVPTGDTSGIDADKLLEEIEKGGSTLREAPAEDGSNISKPTTKETQEPVKFPDVEFTWNQKKVKAPWEKAVQWTQQGYDYAQKMNEFKSKQAEYEAKRKEFDSRYGVYTQIDEFAKANPEWWQHVNTAWNSRGQPQGTTQTQQVAADLPQWVKEKLSKVDEFISKSEAERQAQEIAKADQALDSEVKSIKDSYKGLDWNTADETGLTLEQKVLQHGIENNLPSFRAAFRDYQFDNMMKLSEEKGKESLGRDFQKRSKVGLLGNSSTPRKEVSSVENVRNKSYDDILNETLQEYGIAKTR